MKLKKLCMSIVVFMFSITPLQASVNKNIIIVSKQLPYIIYVEIKDEEHMKVAFISRDLALPTTCSSEGIVPLKKIDLYSDLKCVKSSVESFYKVKANHYVYIHLNRIANDLDLPYKNINFKKISNITEYFENVVKELDLSTIVQYNKYIKSNMDIGDYYDYYHMFKGKKVAISYSITNELITSSFALPLDNRFHTIN